MQTVTLIGRYRVYKYHRRWIVTRTHAHGEACISSHGSHATACGAARRYHEADLRRGHDYREAVKKFVG